MFFFFQKISVVFIDQDCHVHFHVASWHVSCSLAMLALLLSKNVLEICCSAFCEINNLNVTVKQETNIRQHNATPGRNEQETQI